MYAYMTYYKINTRTRTWPTTDLAHMYVYMTYYKNNTHVRVHDLLQI